MPPGRLLVAFVNASHFLLATATVGFHLSESYSTTARWRSSQRPWFVYNCFIDCHDGTCWRNLFCPQLRPSRDPTLQASTNSHLQPVSHICQSGQINCSVWSPTENYRAKVPGGCSCSLSPRVSFFFFSVSIQSDRQGAIFGACCGGCFYLAHPSRLVFKAWPSGLGMIRTLFQSPAPLKTRQSSAWTQKIVSISND